MEFLEIWFTPISILIATGSLFWGFYIYKKQSDIQIFLEYTKRYEIIMDSFPENARFCRLDFSKDLPSESNELTIAVLKYINLCSEEYYLRERRLLSKKVWNMWKDELERTLKSELVRREWLKVKIEFETYPKFKNYVESVINKDSG